MSQPGNTVRLHVLPPDGWQPQRGAPPPREVCIDGPRPCRYVDCPNHLWVMDDETTPVGPGMKSHTHVERIHHCSKCGEHGHNAARCGRADAAPALRIAGESCARDVAAEPRSSAEIAAFLGLTRRHVNRIIKKLREQLLPVIEAGLLGT